MSMVSFKRGLLANLPATKAPGTFYVTTDERAMYLDVDASTRIRLGDFQEFATVDALTTNANPNTSALYYVTDINCLAKWNGSEYIQINRDTGMTSVEVTGTGNAITAAVYDASGRKLTLTKGATYMTSADVDGKISNKVGEIDGTVKAYVDAKTDGIATDEALQGLTTRIATAEGEIDNLQAAIGTEGSVTKAIADAKKAGTDAQATAEAAQALAETKATIDEVKALDYATKTEAKGYADAKDATIAEAKKAGTDAQSAVDALSGKVGTVAEGKTIVKMIEEAKAAATYDDTTLKGRVKAIEDDYLKAADKTALQSAIDTEKGRMDAFLDAADIGDAAIDTLKELQGYITTHGEAAATLTTKVGTLETTVGKAAGDGTEATGLIKDIADNKVAIATEKKRAEDKEAKLVAADATNLQAAKDYADEKITGLGIGDYAKKADLDSHTGNTVVHIAADERTKWNAAEGKAHEHANKDLLDTYTQTEENLADAVSKKHSHSFVEAELNKIKDGDVANWNAAEQNAKDYADGLAKNYDKAGAATTAETNAKAHAESLLTWDEF